MTSVSDTIGRYKVLGKLGQGGMSVVYKAFDSILEREVAIKVLHPHLAQKEESRRRLAREAKAVARLRHPNILEVHDFCGDTAENAYLVTEYIDGCTLREALNEQSIYPSEIAAMIVHEVASALAHAHQSGVIHRDLKPENVMVRADGLIKLTDFGIAKVIDRDDKMTMTGALVGSPAHMAPEIIEGEESGAPADVFSLGTMLYLMVTGRLPFTAPNTTATLRRILDGVYDDPRALVPSVSDALANIVARCLARQPGQRFQNAVELHLALKEFLQQRGVDQVTKEVAAYFASPTKYRESFIPRLVSALIVKSEKHLKEARPALALSELNQALSLAPENQRARALLDKINRTHRRHRMMRRIAGLGMGVLATSTIVWGLYRRPPATEPLSPPVRAIPLAPAPEPLPQNVTLPEKQEPEKAMAPQVVRPPPSKKVTLALATQIEVKPSQESPLFELAINIRPWGSIQIDQGPHSEVERMRHTVRLPLGSHQLRIQCEKYCVEGGVVIPIELNAESESVLHLAAPLKDARIRFEGFPNDAEVQVGTERKTVLESQNQPFVVSMPREGLPQMAHPIVWTISHPLYKPKQAKDWVEPGHDKVIKGLLEPL